MQDQFLKSIVDARVAVTIYLMNGIRLVGQVVSFDQYGLVLGGSSQQFVFKHAISTIVPAGQIVAHPPAAAAPAAAAPAINPAPAVAAPKAEAPKMDAPKAEASGTEASGTAASGTLTPKPDGPKLTLRPRAKRTLGPK